MAGQTQKNNQEHLEMLQKSISLMLWFAFTWKQNHPDEDFKHIVEYRVDIFRRTRLHPGEIFDFMDPAASEEWQELKGRLEWVASRSESAEEFETRAFPLVKNLLEGRVGKDLADLHEGRIFHQYTESCLHFDDKLMAEGNKRINFHIANSLYPNSIFDDPKYVAKCLIKMMDKAEAELGAQELCTKTWLNSFAGWVKYFPPVWKDNMSPENHDAEDHLGFWGQFLTGRQTFADAIGRKMRKLGTFPYPMRESWCSFAEMRAYLAEKFAV